MIIVLKPDATKHDKDHILKRSRLAGLEGVLFKKPLDPEKLRSCIPGCKSLDAAGPDR